jgi:hypothetical protein
MIIGIDHIVYACKDLDSGIREIKDMTGVEAVYGGKHLAFGTHNALINLGKEVYLEIIAPDPDNQNVKSPRWMGVDLIEGKGRITRVALKSDDLQKDVETLRKIAPEYGNWGAGSRQTSGGKEISWKMSYPLAEPLVDLVPFYVEWEGNYHPTQDLEETLEVGHVNIYTSNPGFFASLYSVDAVVVHPGTEEALRVELENKKGQIISFT